MKIVLRILVTFAFGLSAAAAVPWAAAVVAAGELGSDGCQGLVARVAAILFGIGRLRGSESGDSQSPATVGGIPFGIGSPLMKTFRWR